MHVTLGIHAARAARQPVRAILLRLALIDGLILAGKESMARTSARHLTGLRHQALPPLLKARIDAVSTLLDKPARGLPLAGCAAAARESAPRFEPALPGNGIEDLNGLKDVLSFSQQAEKETEALERAAETIKRHVHAAGVGIFGWQAGTVRLLGECGGSNRTIAARAAGIGQPIFPERASGWIDAAVPIPYLGRSVGAIAIRWSIDGPERVERTMAFVSACALACAPLLYVLLDQQSAPPADEPPQDILGVSASIEEVRRAIRRAANAPFTVLIEGESGSGKELVARAIHRASRRRERPFCAFNCAAMPEDLVDAELFGHAKGAFTGAAVERLGLFEGADGGTVFLDEVIELSARAQAKVLRVLQEGEVRRIGENFTRAFDARLVAATNRCLRTEVAAGRFREDLLYRLDVIRITVPPLRERAEDIPLLAMRFWRQAAERIGSKAVLGQGALAALARYDWPGNVRELQNALTALVVAARPRGVVSASELPASIAGAGQQESHESLEKARTNFEARFVRAALARAAGHRGRTAAALGVSRQGLAKLLQRLNLDV